MFGCNSTNKQTSVEKKTLFKDTSITVNAEKKDSAIIPVTTIKKEEKKNSIDNSSNIPVVNNGDISIIYATSQKWHGGIRGSGGGTNYEICITADRSPGILIDELWIGKIWHGIKLGHKSGNQTSAVKSVIDTIYIYTSDYRKDPDFKNTQVKDTVQIKKPDTTGLKTPPFIYQGVALIGYKFGNLRKYKAVSTFVSKPTLNYP